MPAAKSARIGLRPLPAAAGFAIALLLTIGFAYVFRQPLPQPPAPTLMSEGRQEAASGTAPAPNDPPAVPAPVAASASDWREVPSDELAAELTRSLPRRELRGAWVATVANIDWPSKPGLDMQSQQREMRAIIAAASDLRLNALMLQVRPSCDAIYASDLEPWSEFLTGSSGTSPGYDPLALWVKECHAAGIELHAWFNPFRSRHFKAKGPDAPNHVNNTMTDIVYDYDQYKWMDPGSERSQAWALGVVRDVLERYDIDGVHLDDYFYPYPKAGLPFPDSATYNAYVEAGGGLELGAWRRSRIDTFVADLYAMCKQVKPYVRVGISPFGIWRPGNPAGIEGFDAYDKLHADARKWLQDGTLDYCSPQLYWAMGAPKQPFGKLLDWWLAQAGDRPVIPGIYTSRLDPSTKQWEPAEVLGQIELTRERPGTAGVIHFSMKALRDNYKGITPMLSQGPYAIPALTPDFPSCPSTASPLRGIVIQSTPGGTTHVKWPTPPEDACRMIVVAWRTSPESGWQWAYVPAGAGTFTASFEAGQVSLAPVGRGGSLGPWSMFTFK